MKQEFALQPFVHNNPPFSISTFVDYHRGLLELKYRLDGDLSNILIPTPTDTPIRRSALWEATCFELFLAPVGRSNYWEFNLSPSGNWQVFQLDDYRQGLREETAINYLPFDVQQTDESLQLILSIDLSSLVTLNTSLAMGVTAVIQAQDASYSYWALQHPSAEADFHLRDSFKISL